jgi:hypothetical protein
VNKRIAVTPIHLDLTGRRLLRRLKTWHWDLAAGKIGSGKRRTRGRDETNPVPLKGLEAGAAPLQHLAWLIEAPLLAAALWGPGVLVRIPQPARYAVHKLILAQAYGRKPPGAFVLVFRLDRQSGTFGTVMSTTLPDAAQRWAYLTHFDLTLHRTYTYRGQPHSYVSAACTAPAGFDTALFPFARATYDFATGQSLTTGVARSCRVATSPR